MLGGIGGKPTSGLSPTAAAFANAGLIHSLDFDDVHDGAHLHPTTVVLPAVLAVADLIGSDDSERLSDNSKLVICVFNTNTNVINQELFLASIGMLNCQTFAAVFIV